MEKYHTFKWGNFEKEYTMILLNEDDIQNEVYLCGFEILVIPSKYMNKSNKYLDNLKEIAKFRNGRIIYI